MNSRIKTSEFECRIIPPPGTEDYEDKAKRLELRMEALEGRTSANSRRIEELVTKRQSIVDDAWEMLETAFKYILHRSNWRDTSPVLQRLERYWRNAESALSEVDREIDELEAKVK